METLLRQHYMHDWRLGHQVSSSNKGIIGIASEISPKCASNIDLSKSIF